MSTKAEFIAAMGGTLKPFGPPTPITDSSVAVVTATAHGYETGAGPFKIMNNNAGIDSNLVAAVHAETFMTGAVMVDTDVLVVNGVSYLLITVPVAANDVDEGATDAKTMANIAAAINQDQPAGATTYFADTPGQVGTVKAIIRNSDIIVLQAVTLEAVVGNAIAVSSVDASMNVDNPLMEGGVDGTDYFLIRVDADTLSLALTKADALAGTIVDLASDTTGISQLVPTTDTLSDHLEDVVVNYLTANGAKSIPADYSIPKFWRSAIDGTASDIQN